MLIKLNSPENKEIVLNLDNIIFLRKSGKITEIKDIDGEYYQIKETIEEIFKIIGSNSDFAVNI